MKQILKVPGIGWREEHEILLRVRVGRRDVDWHAEVDRCVLHS